MQITSSALQEQYSTQHTLHLWKFTDEAELLSWNALDCVKGFLIFWSPSLARGPPCNH